MHREAYYREIAARVRRVAEHAYQQEVIDVLVRLAQDYDEVADDLRDGAVNVRHTELMQ
jgi:hypothetical protein